MASGKGGKLFEELTLAFPKGEPVAYRFLSQGNTKVAQLSDEDFDLKCSQNGNITSYEFKISWNDLFGVEYSPSCSSLLGFSGLVNDDDGYGRKGWMEFGSGIGNGKDVNQFVKLRLFDEENLESQKPDFEKLALLSECAEARELNILKSGIALKINSPYAYSNGSKMQIDAYNTEVVPIIKDGRTLVPIRFISECLGATVDWNDENKEATISLSDKIIKIKTDSNIINIDGKEKEIDVPALIINGRLMLPLRAVSEALDKNVYWNDGGFVLVSSKKLANTISVEKEKTATNKGYSEDYSRWYDEPSGVHLLEKRVSTAESDFYTAAQVRESSDNGEIFSEWQDVYGDDFEKLDNGNEIMYYNFNPTTYDKTSKNFVACGLMRYFIGDHQTAYDKEYADGTRTYSDHVYLVYKTPDGKLHKQHIKYEKGADFEDGNPEDDAYFNKNRAYFSKVEFASNGDLLMSIGADVRACCRILGLDVNKVFPSCPDIMMGTILVRGHWNSSTNEYDLTYSEPVVISDIKSSRGVCEPCVAELKSGRIVIVFRGSNVGQDSWDTRVNSATPGFKWYCYSDDGGKTFSEVLPWNFDSKEVVYSSATISYFFRSSKTGRLYWIGNITDPTKIDGNFPRYPLYICQVNDDYGYLMKNTLTEIDTKQPGESDKVQLSNFTMLENRETKELELRLTKLGLTYNSNQYDLTECWTYYIDFD